MREILFRGKRMDNGKWVEGDLAHCNGIRAQNPIVCIWETDEDGLYNEAWVDPCTVGQFTGLTDKNGNRIFEGDIVKAMSVPMLVIFDEESAHFFARYYMDGHKDCFENTLYGHDRLTVIGNIHDNPELMEVHNE